MFGFKNENSQTDEEAEKSSDNLEKYNKATKPIDKAVIEDKISNSEQSDENKDNLVKQQASSKETFKRKNQPSNKTFNFSKNKNKKKKDDEKSTSSDNSEQDNKKNAEAPANQTSTKKPEKEPSGK